MRFVRFGEHARGTLFALLLDAYAENKFLVNKHQREWKAFDDFIFDNLEFTEATGFITVEDEKPVGFISWDPRPLPEQVEIGHNCIVGDYRGRGLGGQQLGHTLKMIGELNPSRITVKTGDDPFFEPARRMYKSAGFNEKRRIFLKGQTQPGAIEYELAL